MGAVFQNCMGATSSTVVQLFKHFQVYWAFIDTTKYKPRIAADVANLVEDIRQSTIDFAIKHLEQSQPKDDYKEFLELLIVFLGAAPARGVQFMLPRAIHHIAG